MSSATRSRWGRCDERLAVDGGRADRAARPAAGRRRAPGRGARPGRAGGGRDAGDDGGAADRGGHQPRGFRRPRARARRDVVRRRDRVPALPGAGAVTLRAIVVDALLIGGAALVVLGCAGVVLMREALDRVHYTTPAALGCALLALAVLVQGGWSQIGLRAILLAAFVLVTAPVLAHATARMIRVEEREGDAR